ncbi:MAG: hypothetical protein A2X36_17400 [Elusimicrobia bacterium GWA2_69_24]|nr:MAG: hypothetical protein A2X36_17400 [Elusimicrobia bacterium GWA2_69_24]
MISTDVLVVGGGLAGLSTAYHLARLDPKVRVLVAEQEPRVGGRAGTLEKNGFLFDHTGHLLHLHTPYGKRLVTSLLRGNLALHERSSWIHSFGTDTRYPFQANTHGLPPRVVSECVAYFMKNLYRPPAAGPDPSFERWSVASFGEGIARHFMRPYNRKLWRGPLDRLTTHWQGRFLPRPSPEEVLYGALMDQKAFFGYNAFFRYPVRGGIQSLPDALAAGLASVRVGCRVTRVDLEAKVAAVSGLGDVRYERLVNTMPLSDFLAIAAPLPPRIREAGRRLRRVSVYNLNLGVARPRLSDKHWLYFPERRFVFYRVGFPHNFSPRLAPRGTSSMYIEVSRRPGERADLRELERGCLAGLRECGLLRRSDELAARLWIPIECAYVVYDREREPALRTLLPFLAGKGAASIGRWGAWKYSFMEESILDGKRCAENLLGAGTAEEAPSARPLVALR